MHEPSDGIAEEVERQLQLGLAAAAVAARRTAAARRRAVDEAKADSGTRADVLRAQIEGERRLAAAQMEPVFDSGWWDTASPADVADMWEQANSWSEMDKPTTAPTIFDHAAARISEEVRDRSGLDVTQVVALAAVQQLEREHQAALANPDELRQASSRDTAGVDAVAPPRVSTSERREELRAALAAAGLPTDAIDARTLADIGQAREPAEAIRAPAVDASRSRPPAARTRGRELTRRQ